MYNSNDRHLLDRAVDDPHFRQLLVSDPAAAIEGLRGRRPNNVAITEENRTSLRDLLERAAKDGSFRTLLISKPDAALKAVGAPSGVGAITIEGQDAKPRDECHAWSLITYQEW